MRILTDFPERFQQHKNLILDNNEGESEEHTLEYVKYYAKEPIIKFEDIQDRTDADYYRGYYVCIHKKDIPELEDDTYYLFDLVNMNVVDETGSEIGRVVKVERMPANDILVVALKEKTIMVPAVKDFISDVNMSSRTIKMNLVDGLPEYPKEGL